MCWPFLERVVGGQSSVPHTCFCAHASPPDSARAGRRHYISLHHRWARVGVKESQGSGPRQRCTNWRWSFHHSPISRGGPDRRNSLSLFAGPAGRRRKLILWNQSSQTWLCSVQERRGRKCNSHFYEEELTAKRVPPVPSRIRKSYTSHKTLRILAAIPTSFFFNLHSRASRPPPHDLKP